MTGIEWWCRVVFHAELNASGDTPTCNFGDDSKSEINTRGYATCGKQITVFYDSSLFAFGPNEGQEINIGPVGRSPLPLSTIRPRLKRMHRYKLT
jgi:hypothetical protein